VAYPLEAIAQLYRARCDCENSFDELKTRWGRVALPRRTSPAARRWRGRRTGLQPVESILPGSRSRCSSGSGDKPRPLPLAAVGKTIDHSGLTQPYLTPLHAKSDTIKITGRQRSRGAGPRRALCGAVPEARPLARAAALHLRTHHRIYAPAPPIDR